MKQNTAIKSYRMYIGGEFVDSSSQSYIESVNPASGEVWAYIPRGEKEDVDRAFQAAQQCFESKEWRDLSPTRRGKLLRKLAQVIEENAEHLARIETQDNGKLYREMLAWQIR